MIIRNIRHRGLRRLFEGVDRSGLPPAVVPKLRRILSFLGQIGNEDELHLVASWKAHQMTGDRKGVWALYVTKNWRITFAIDKSASQIIDLDYEDYH